MTNVYLIPQLAAGQTGDFQDKDRFPEWESRFREQMQYHGFRRARLTVIDNAGHIPHFELPAIFNPLLLEYLQREPKKSFV